MSYQRISGRQLRHGSPEESLAPGQSVRVEKRGGKVFELTRIDAGSRNINAQLDQLFADLPPEGSRTKTNLAAVILEERE
jgi:hypothetical protein